MKFVSILCSSTILLITCNNYVSAEANTGWNDGHSTYLKADGSYAKGLFTVDGIKYYFDSEGQLIGPYTGWTKKKDGQKNYYINGKRRVNWTVINNKRYYFLYDGGCAVGKYQIGDNIYVFNDNGVWTGRTEEPILYVHDLKEKLYADDLPMQINFKWAFKVGDYYKYSLQRTKDDSEGVDIQRFENGKWVDVCMNIEYLKDKYGTDFVIGASGIGDYILEDRNGNPYPDDMLFETQIILNTSLYHDRLTSGIYRAALPMIINSDADEYYKNNLYYYFKIY